MSKTTIITESGADYVFDKGFVHYIGHDMGRIELLQSAPLLVFDPDKTYPLSEIRARMPECSPEDIQVGDVFYLTTFKGWWRLASAAVSVVTEDE